MSTRRLRRGNWSVQELERLRALLPFRGVKVTAALLRRSADSVQRKALDLLSVPSRKGDWTDSDDWQLRQAWGAVELRLLAPMLGRPASEVLARANGLRQRTTSGPWSFTELRLLKKLYGTRSDQDLEVSLMRSRVEIAEIAERLCLAKDKRFQAERGQLLVDEPVRFAMAADTAKARPSRVRSAMPRWTAEEVDRLQEIYPEHDNLAVARALGRTVISVANKAYQLGLRKSTTLLASIGRLNVAHRYVQSDDASREATMAQPLQTAPVVLVRGAKEGVVAGQPVAKALSQSSNANEA